MDSFLPGQAKALWFPNHLHFKKALKQLWPYCANVDYLIVHKGDTFFKPFAQMFNLFHENYVARS